MDTNEKILYIGMTLFLLAVAGLLVAWIVDGIIVTSTCQAHGWESGASSLWGVDRCVNYITEYKALSDVIRGGG